MPVPASTGQLRTSIKDMEIGDYIKISLDFNKSWEKGFSITDSSFNEYNISSPTWTGSGYFYGIKVDKGLIISDRVIFIKYSWNDLNNLKLIEGITSQEDSTLNFKVRSLTGGVAYADKNGNKSLTDQGYGAWPTNNEWDKYITNFPSQLIQSGKALDDVFHWSGIYTLCQDTPILQIASSSRRVNRGNIDSKGFLGILPTSNSGTSYGFRPTFEYKE